MIPVAVFVLVLLAVSLPLSGISRAAGPEHGLDSRAWELVSPPEKNGGDVEGPVRRGGAVQAAAAGGSLAFASSASFAAPSGAPPLSQYVSQRGPGSWLTVNLSPPALAGTYAGGAYQAFSDDIRGAILANGWRCRDGSSICPAEGPALGGGAPSGYRNLYLARGGIYTPLITTANSPALSIPADRFSLSLAGATPDLASVVISTCAALTAEATEVPDGEGGCDEGAQNLYRWSGGSLEALNELPAETGTAPGAVLAAPIGALSDDGERVYFSHLEDGALYLREAGGPTRLLPGTLGGASFQAASSDGRYGVYTVGTELFRYDSQLGTSQLLATAVTAVLAVSADGNYVYYQDSSALRVWHLGTTVLIAPGAGAAAAGDFPPATATVRTSSDGSRLAFLSSANLTNAENVGSTTEAYIFDSSAAELTCVSCSPFGSVPLGPSTIPGVRMAGGGPPIYRPRALSADGSRLFFDSEDRLLSVDTDKAPDVYQWLAPGAGGCAEAQGCIGLISSGRQGRDQFVDASSDGTDVFFRTDASLLPQDTDAFDAYDARVGGGFPEPPPRPPCEGDDCQGPPPGPDDLTPGTSVFVGPENPQVHYPRVRKRRHPQKHRKRHRRRRRSAHRGGAR